MRALALILKLTSSLLHISFIRKNLYKTKFSALTYTCHCLVSYAHKLCTLYCSCTITA